MPSCIGFYKLSLFFKDNDRLQHSLILTWPDLNSLVMFSSPEPSTNYRILLRNSAGEPPHSIRNGYTVTHRWILTEDMKNRSREWLSWRLWTTHTQSSSMMHLSVGRKWKMLKRSADWNKKNTVKLTFDLKILDIFRILFLLYLYL